MKWNVIAFLLNREPSEAEEHFIKSYIIEHSLQELTVENSETSNDIISRLKRRLGHHIKESYKEIEDLIYQYVIIKGVMAENEEKAVLMALRIPPVAGWNPKKVIAYAFPDFELVVDPKLSDDRTFWIDIALKLLANR